MYLYLPISHGELFPAEKRYGANSAEKQREKRETKTIKHLRKVGAMMGDLLHVCAVWLAEERPKKS